LAVVKDASGVATTEIGSVTTRYHTREVRRPVTVGCVGPTRRAWERTGTTARIIKEEVMDLKKPKFEMCDVLRDEVSGFKGVVLGIYFYATGCVHYGLAPQKLKDDGTIHTWEAVDESRCVLVKKAKRPVKVEDRSGPDHSPKMK
jgi:hypothetical protein